MRCRPTRALRATAALVVATTLVAGCSGGGGSGATGPSSTSNPISSIKSRTAPACVLVTKRDASRLFGRSAREVAVQNAGQAASVCGWKADTIRDPNAFADVAYSLLVYVYDDTDHYSERATPRAQSLSGIGDRAFTSQAADLLTVEFVDKGQTVSLRYAITSLVKHPDPGAGRPVLRDLARIAAGRM